MDDELSLDFIDELLADPKTKAESKQYERPVFTSEYVKCTNGYQKCLHGKCGSPTYFTVKDVPYCTVHTIEILGNLLDEKINHYPSSTPKMEQILEAYLETGKVIREIYDNN